jgi:hypothetical protein
MTREANAPPLVFFDRRRVRRIPNRRSRKVSRARGTPGSGRTRGPSTPRDIEVCRSPNSRKYAVSMASRARCFRFAPSRPRWTARFRQPAFPLELAGRLSTAVGPGRVRQTCDRLLVPPSRGPATRGWRAGTKRLGPPVGIGAASPAPPTGHRLPPRVRRRLIRRPSAARAGCRYLIL